MTQTVIPVTKQDLSRQTTLKSGIYTSSYDLDTWHNLNKMIKTNVIYLGQDDDDNVLTKEVNNYLDEFLAKTCQPIFTNFDNKFNGLNANKIFKYDSFNSNFKIVNYHYKKIIKINFTLVISLSNNFRADNSSYHAQLINYMVKQFNHYFAQQDFQISFCPQWLLVNDYFNQYQLMLNAKSLDEQLSSLKVKILEQAQQFLQTLALSKNAINQVNQQSKQLLPLMANLEYSLKNEHDLINNLCDYYYYNHKIIDTNEYIKQMTADIHRLHQQAKAYDDNVINYLHQINIDNTTIKTVLNKHISKIDYENILKLDEDLQLGVLFNNSSLNDKINNIEQLDESNYAACGSLYNNESYYLLVSEFIYNMITKLMKNANLEVTCE